MSRLPSAYAGRQRQGARRAARAKADAQLAGAPAGPSEYLTVAEIPRPNAALAKQFPPWGEERDFRPAVMAYARELRLETHHEGISLGTKSGWLDITFWAPRAGGWMLRELKGSSHGGATRTKMRRSQLDRINSMRAAGIDADIWHPEDWHLGICQAQMRALAHGTGLIVPLPPLVGQGQPGAAGPVRDPSKRYAKCGCEIGPHGIGDHTCTAWGSGGPAWKGQR